MKAFFGLTCLFLSFNVSAGSLALLSPEALGCYEAVMSEKNSDVLSNAKIHATTDMEKIAIGLCTYSNAAGALKCIRDASKDSIVMKARKQIVNIVGLDRDYARLCSNTRISKAFPESRDVDAVECFKTVYNDPEVFVEKKRGSAAALEAEIISLCISSNGKGATTCFKKSMAEKVRLFGENLDYKTRGTLEIQIATLCRGTRL